MTRGELGNVVSLPFAPEGRLHVSPTERGNALVTIESPGELLIHADDAAIAYAGPDDPRDIPAPFAHRVIGILRATRGDEPDLRHEVIAYMRHAGVGQPTEGPDGHG